MFPRSSFGLSTYLGSHIRQVETENFFLLSKMLDSKDKQVAGNGRTIGNLSQLLLMDQRISHIPRMWLQAFIISIRVLHTFTKLS